MPVAADKMDTGAAPLGSGGGRLVRVVGCRTQPEGVRSGPGDLDLIVYSLRKWMRLALTGNPTVL